MVILGTTVEFERQEREREKRGGSVEVSSPSNLVTVGGGRGTSGA